MLLSSVCEPRALDCHLVEGSGAEAGSSESSLSAFISTVKKWTHTLTNTCAKTARIEHLESSGMSPQWVHVRDDAFVDANDDPLNAEWVELDQDENTDEDRSTFEYSKRLLSFIVLAQSTCGDPDELVKHLPKATEEKEDVLVMALVVFLQIMCHVNKQYDCCSWDNDSLQSRIAVAMSVSLSYKFVMDKQPLGPRYALSQVLKEGEVSNDYDMLIEWITKYELIVLRHIPLYRCYLNHKTWAYTFLNNAVKTGKVSKTAVSWTRELIYFFSFHIGQWLPRYSEKGENKIAAALTILSLECVSLVGCCAVSNEVLGNVQEYAVAINMASHASQASTRPVQRMLGRFAVPGSWRMQATDQNNIKNAKLSLERKVLSSRVAF